ncbi:MAG: hypothetical protein QM479_15940 [Pseudomonadota bacterium]
MAGTSKIIEVTEGLAFYKCFIKREAPFFMDRWRLDNMNIKQMKQIITICLFFTLLVTQSITFAAEKIFPFYLAAQSKGDAAAVLADTKTKLTAAGFEIAGEYSPYAGAHIVIITNDELKSNASASEMGGFGAAQRVSITDVKGDIQLAYTNPIYMANAYRMKGKLNSIEAKLKSTLGFVKAYGPAQGLKTDDIDGYHYMFGMPYFDDPVEIADHGNYKKAVSTLEKGLASKKGGVSKVFKVEFKGGALFGVAMTKGMSSDKTIMKEIDFKAIRSTAQLPYEILVTEKGTVYILAAEYRIAINFPDLSMAGSNSFMGIMASPDAIIDAIKVVAK